MSYERLRVGVRGGELTVGRWGSGPRTVLSVHGITGNHLGSAAMASALGDGWTVLAPDLRGRGGSRDLPGPWGMAQHASDCVAVLDHVGVDEAIWVGHSMGGFVSVVAAHRHADRVERLVLVDGGMPLDLGPLADLPADELIKAVIGPALERLRMTFESVDAYLDFWKPHPALAGEWNDYVEEHYRYDLEDGRSSVSEEAVLADGGEDLTSDETRTAVEQLAKPTVLLTAPRGLMNQTPGLYTPDSLAPWTSKLASLTVREVPDVNHYTIMFSASGAGAVADAVRS